VSTHGAATTIDGHAGEQAVAALRSYGVDVMFTLNGGHVWPLYEAARNQGVRVIDTRHEQSATFAAEAYAKLTRTAGVAVLTAGPGITNGVSAITSAWFNGSPLVVLGGRAPQGRWGAGSLQELDHVPIVASITKSAATVTDPTQAGRLVHEALATAVTPHRGPTFLDFPLDVFGPSSGELPAVTAQFGHAAEPDPAAVARLAERIARAERPAFIVGSDAYWVGPRMHCRPRRNRWSSPCSPTGSGGAWWRQTTSWPSCGPVGC
jgi:acetolactate synthase-1/2/3 large subunit